MNEDAGITVEVAELCTELQPHPPLVPSNEPTNHSAVDDVEI